ncbi:hypothetical protein D9757_004815 [Collybiopsis confluens]|uniref:Uncharacterized protein n=1 Tax=Collybiopsis confluens TaxID=2823264 RepID=A0A8H5HSE3_9AGAR|nr:hypothetical protein D9757_004815 [Collybiopsis confluens]
MRPIFTRRLLYGIFLYLASAFAAITWVWSAVLLSYNNQPHLLHALTQARAHFISFVVFAALWLGIMVLSEIPFVCQYRFDDQGYNSSSCGLTITTGGLGLILSALSALAAISVYYSSRPYGGVFEAQLASQADDVGTIAHKRRSSALDCRIACYSLLLTLGIGLDIVGPLNIPLNSQRHFMLQFSSVATAFALFTWVWSCVLLTFNECPNSSHILTRISVHFFSVVAFGVVWLAFGIMFASELKYECDFTRDSDGLASTWCAFDGTLTGLSFSMSLLAGITAALIYRKGSAWNGNISEYEIEMYEEHS